MNKYGKSPTTANFWLYLIRVKLSHITVGEVVVAERLQAGIPSVWCSTSITAGSAADSAGGAYSAFRTR